MPRIGRQHNSMRTHHVVVMRRLAAIGAVAALSQPLVASSPQPPLRVNDPATLSTKEVPDQAIPPAASDLEARPLGRPNSGLSARPVAGEDEAASRSSAWRAIDPRRNDFTRVLGALAAVVGLMLLIKTIAGRWLPMVNGHRTERPSGVVEVLARYPISRGQHLVVLKFARRVLLLHQAGSACRTLAEMTDAGEVASLLSRLEAGSQERTAGKFRAALESFESEHRDAAAKSSRAGASVAATETQVIDLTRTRIIGAGGVARRPVR